MSIREAARLVIKSATINDGNVFVLDMGKPIKILELAKNLIKISGHNENEIPIIFTGLRPGEKMYEETLTDNENLSKTLYEKLFVSNENSAIMDKKEIEKLIDKTFQTANTFDKKTIIQYIKNYVPEFIDD
jgi:FlaA1/EpsC-like NDP-sugar epimerase